MKRRTFLTGLAAAVVATPALGQGKTLVQRVIMIKGCLCKGCGSRFETALKKIEGIEKVSLEIATGKLTLVHRSTVSQKTIVDAIKKSPFALKELGEPTPVGPDR